MKHLSLALGTAGLVLASMTVASPSFADSQSYRDGERSYLGASQGRVRGYAQRRRDYDDLPISVTRPPNTGHYQYRGYPLWAARAFHPNDGSR